MKMTAIKYSYSEPGRETFSQNLSTLFSLPDFFTIAKTQLNDREKNAL
jgi:hypothetical protein